MLRATLDVRATRARVTKLRMASSSSGARSIDEEEADWQVHRWMEEQLRTAREPWFRNTTRSGLHALMLQEKGGDGPAVVEPVQEDEREKESVSRPPVDKRKPVTLKAVVIGDAGTGKTSLMNQYVGGTFSNRFQHGANGLPLLQKTVFIDDRTVRMQVIPCFFFSLLFFF